MAIKCIDSLFNNIAVYDHRHKKSYIFCLHGILHISSGREEGGEGGIPPCSAGSTPSHPPQEPLCLLGTGHATSAICTLMFPGAPGLPCQEEMDPTGMQCRGLPGCGSSLPAGLGTHVGCGIRVCGAAPALQEEIAPELVEMFKSGAGVCGGRIESGGLGWVQ